MWQGMSATTAPICSIPHLRTPWRGDEIVRVCGRLDALKGTGRRPAWRRDQFVGLYNQAKFRDDTDSAIQIIRDMVPDDALVLDRIIDDAEPHMKRGTPILLACPSPAFDAPEDLALANRKLISVNALPHTLATELAGAIGGEPDIEIAQVARVGRTKLTGLQRFLWQPNFAGEVRRDAAYILVDDVLTKGASFAAMRSYVLSQGGTVCSYVALAHGSGNDRSLALTARVRDELIALFGNEFSGFWRREIGHDMESLTDAEGLSLIEWWRKADKRSGASPIQRLRDSLLETKSRGSDQESSKTARG